MLIGTMHEKHKPPLPYPETSAGRSHHPSCWPRVCSSVLCKLWWRKTFFLLYVCREIGPLGGCPHLPVKVECCRDPAACSFGFSNTVASPSVLAVGFREPCPTAVRKFCVTSAERASYAPLECLIASASSLSFKKLLRHRLEI